MGGYNVDTNTKMMYTLLILYNVKIVSRVIHYIVLKRKYSLESLVSLKKRYKM